MEGGNKTPIDLEAGLDITSSDMLTPLSGVTFQHNWQKYQGRFLPNSLRFEKNGWAAGWNVYNFDFVTFRQKIASDVYIESGQLNTYVKLVSVYKDETSLKSLKDIYVIDKNTLLTGDVIIEDNKVTGSVKDKPFELSWDPNTKTLTSLTAGITAVDKLNSDYSHTVSVTDDSSSFSFDFDLLLGSNLTGSSIDNVTYTGYADGKYTWSGYLYDLNTATMTTPEGDDVIVLVTDNNELNFNYSHAVTDEVMTVTYQISKYYPKFTDIYAQDLTNKSKLKIGNGTELVKFNEYKVSVKPKVLESRDEDGIVVDIKLPVWGTCGTKIKMSNANAKLCDNCRHNEVAVTVGTGIGVKVKYTNIYTGTQIEEPLIDNYRLSKVSGSYPQYITGLTYRFNQILISNTIEPSKLWSPLLHTLSAGEIWVLNTRQYSTLRAKDTAYLKKLLGDVYTYGSFTYNAADLFEENNIFDWSNSTNVCYTAPDISGYPSIKPFGGASISIFKNDKDIVDEVLGTNKARLETYIAKLTGAVTEYTASQTQKEYSALYDAAGTYIGGTYESVDIDTGDNTLWPFEKVPKFNFKVDESNTIKGVYWTDGVSVITDLEEFKKLVLGSYSPELDPKNDPLVSNTKYNRTRLVKTYAPGYDFNMPDRSNYSSDTDFAEAKITWKDKWNAMYPSYDCPLDFDEKRSFEDSTYLNYGNIELQLNVKPNVLFANPGTYEKGFHAVTAMSNSGLIMYTADAATEFKPFVYHHDVDATSYYKVTAQHENGWVNVNGKAIDLPYYFGRATSTEVSIADGNEARFSVKYERSPLQAAALTIGFNYENRLVHYPANIAEQIPEHSKWFWYPTDVKDNCWFTHVLLRYTNGIVSEASETTGSLSNCLNDVEMCGDTYYIAGSINEGIKFAVPLWGHVLAQIIYPEMRSELKINNNDSFTIGSLPTDKLTNRDWIYIDRKDKNLPKSIELFKPMSSGFQADNFDGTGMFDISLVKVREFVLWFANKKFDKEGKEILAPYYIPPVAYSNEEYNDGNLAAVSEPPTVQLVWKPVIINLPTAGMAAFSNNNTTNTSHKFYTVDSMTLNPTVTIGEIDFDTLKIPVTLTLGGVDYKMEYDGITHETTAVSGDTTVFDKVEEFLSCVGCSGKEHTAEVNLYLNLFFNDMKCTFDYVPDTNYTLDKSDTDMAIISKDGVQLIYNKIHQSVVTPKSTYNIIPISKGRHINAFGSNGTSFTAMLRSVFDGTISDNVVTFIYNGSEYSFNLDAISKTETGIRVLSTDIRKPSKTDNIGYIKTDGQYQLLRQQWNTTVEVENYWWIDSKHILELSTSKLTLKRNTEELDDWNGNTFVPIFSIDRAIVLDTTVNRFFVPSVYNTNRESMFVTLRSIGGNIQVQTYDVKNKFKVVDDFMLQPVMHALGEKLNDVTFTGNIAYLNTYDVLTADSVISFAEWSSTIVDNYLILGCHVNNNFNQWAIVYNLDTHTIKSVIHGYGFVGLHGDLTGGMIPNDYMDERRGFNDAVHPLSDLNPIKTKDLNNIDAAYEVGDISRINEIKTIVVGTSKHQWYIRKKLYGVVSHMLYVGNGNFSKQLLPITNNYSAVYKSPSFATSIFGDCMVQGTAFSTLFHFEGFAKGIWKTLMSGAGSPSLFYIAPRFSSLVYLQQTFGQYAYVHYNSSESLPEQEFGSTDMTPEVEGTGQAGQHVKKNNKSTDPVLSSAYKFDKQKFSQSTSTRLDYQSSGILAILLSSFSAALQIFDQKIALNDEQRQTATSDVGKKFVDNVLANTGDVLAAGLVTQSRSNAGVISTVTGLKSLDMFYSTSDKQRVWAGPGFVEHQLVADCVAQSATDIQVEGKVQTLFFCIRALTTLKAKITLAATEIAAKGLRDAADAAKIGMVCGTTFGPAVAAVTYGIAKSLDLSMHVQKVAAEQMEKLLDAICANGITSSVDGAITKHALSVEGTHKYGEKNESFMWPCWGIQPGQLKYTDEWVESGIRSTPWQLNLVARATYTSSMYNMFNIIDSVNVPKYSSNKVSRHTMYSKTGYGSMYDKSYMNKDNEGGDNFRGYFHEGLVPFYQASAFGNSELRDLPNDMAKIEGVSSFLPKDPFKNENIGMSDPVFTTSLIQDYIIDKSWDLAMCCTMGSTQWVAVKDTKVINCPPSNMYVNGVFCGIACPYTAVEVKRGINKAYLRPWAVTPNTLAYNCTGYNTIHDNKMYHSFDGLSYRIVDIIGDPGMNKNRQTYLYAFQVNDRFKRSNKAPANELQGNFEAEAVQALNTIDNVWTRMTVAAKEKGLEGGTIGEDKDLIRWAIPLFTEHVSTLPAAVKTLTAMPLGVVEGVTSLCVELANNQSAYKAPLSVDFTIGKQVYRATEEYICSVQTQNAVDIVTDLVPSLGLKFIGSTPTEAFFYSKSTRCYYSFSGNSVTKMDMMERFRDIQKGYWDFVNQEVVMPCLMTFKRLNAEVEDKDSETDNVIVPVLSRGRVSGELPPPITTIFNDRSWYKCVSLPSGLAYQGPNRVIINRSVLTEYMVDSIKQNFGKWKKLNREKYSLKREYPEEYSTVDKQIQGVDGWTHNPFVLVTSALGSSEDSDCLFEWNITFCWPIEMDLLYSSDNYAVVNITAETMTPGGKVKSRPTHVFLTKELFTRNGNYGYFSFRFQSKNGAGNRERLHIWSDQYIAISSINCESKIVTSRRTEQLTQQIDVQKLKEL